MREPENLIERALILNQRTDSDNLLHFNSLSTNRERERIQTIVESSADTILPLDNVIVTHAQRSLDSSAGRIEGENEKIWDTAWDEKI